VIAVSLATRGGASGPGTPNSLPNSAAASRASPTWPRQSGRFAVRLMSRIQSCAAGAALRSGAPGFADPGSRIRIPGSASFFTLPSSPSSTSEQSIPSLTTPPISRAVSLSPTAGSVVPSGASATSPPGSGTFGAPQTIRCSPPPRSTVTSRSFGRVGCGSTRRTSATTTSAVPAPYSSTPSTSSPARVYRSARSRGDTSRPGRRAEIHACEAFIGAPD